MTNLKKQEQEKAIQNVNVSEKSIADVSLSDVKFKLNSDQTYEAQAKDVVNAMATAKAVQVDAKGHATAGQQAFAVIGLNDDIPSNVIIGGFVLRTKA